MITEGLYTFNAEILYQCCVASVKIALPGISWHRTEKKGLALVNYLYNCLLTFLDQLYVIFFLTNAAERTLMMTVALH